MSARVVVGVLEGHWSFIDARVRRFSRLKSLFSRQSTHLSRKQAFVLAGRASDPAGLERSRPLPRCIRGVCESDPTL